MFPSEPNTFPSHRLSEYSDQPMEDSPYGILTRDEPEWHNGCLPTKTQISCLAHKVWPSNMLMKQGHHTSGNHTAHFTAMHLNHLSATTGLHTAWWASNPCWTKCPVGVSAEEYLKISGTTPAFSTHILSLCYLGAQGGLNFDMGFPHSSVGKESTCNAGDPSLIPGSRRST